MRIRETGKEDLQKVFLFDRPFYPQAAGKVRHWTGGFPKHSTPPWKTDCIAFGEGLGFRV